MKNGNTKEFHIDMTKNGMLKSDYKFEKGKSTNEFQMKKEKRIRSQLHIRIRKKEMIRSGEHCVKPVKTQHWDVPIN